MLLFDITILDNVAIYSIRRGYDFSMIFDKWSCIIKIIMKNSCLFLMRTFSFKKYKTLLSNMAPYVLWEKSE